MYWAVLLLVAPVLCTDYQLRQDVKPMHYDIFLSYNVKKADDFPFYGLAKIQVTAHNAVDQIVLHKEGFITDDSRISVIGPEESKIKVTGTKEDNKTNFFTLELEKKLSKDENYTLVIPFKGNLKNDLDGVYISTYVDKKTNSPEYLIATQFEATSARKGFPCFDEPMYKASFKMVIGHHEDFVATSNMPIYRTSKENPMNDYWPWEKMAETFKIEESKFMWDEFEVSVPMSTYLVAFVVSKFSYVDSPKDLSKTKFRIWARPDAINQTDYASHIGPRVLSFFETWFNVSFPLPKQDMIAIPDFSAGAMENWGLITYRETALLYDEHHSSFSNKERVAEVIAHELAHQWFGNLVTMKWWSDLWLNEGFATYMASVGMQAVEPSWQSDIVSSAEHMQSVLNLDSLESSHPVSAPVDDPNRISEIFDEISYRKGSTLIRMMVMFLGEDVFRKAINSYLNKYSYKNAEQDDLWSELTKVSQDYHVLSRNVTVKEIMDTWTTQTGYPLLTVSRDYDDNSVTVTQKRYLALGAKSETSKSWWVPLSVLCENEVGQKPSDQVQWLSDKEGVNAEHRYEHGSKANEWVLFNVNMLAPIRVSYDERNWKLLIRTLKTSLQDIPTLSRVQLISDSFALAFSNVIDYSIPLELISYLQTEKEYLPISTGIGNLGKIDSILIRSPEYGAFQKFVRKLITPVYESNGGLYTKKILNPTDLNSVKLQTVASRWACHVKVPGCEESAIELFQSWMDYENPDENNPIPLDLRKTVYCVAIARGSVSHWRFLLARKQKSNVAAVRTSIMQALACSRDVWILKQYLEWTVTDGSEVRRQDSGAVIQAVLRTQFGYYVGREFVLNRIQDISNAFKGQGRRIGVIIKSLVDQFTTTKELEEFMIWKEKNAKYLEESQLAVQQSIEKAKINIGWLEKNKLHVIDKLRQMTA